MFPRDASLLSPLGPKTTGIEGAVVWVAAGEFGAGDTLGPRVAIAVGTAIALDAIQDAAVVLLIDPPTLVGQLPEPIRSHAVAFVGTNREALLRYWAGEISTPELLDELNPVR